MLEFILDFVFDIILEGSAMIVSEKKIPIPIRIIAFIIVALLYVGIGGLLIYIGFLSLIEKDYIAALILLSAGLFVFIAGFFQIRKEIKKRK